MQHIILQYRFFSSTKQISANAPVVKGSSSTKSGSHGTSLVTTAYPPAQCSCGAMDSLDHLLGVCPDSFTVKLRQDAIAAARLEFAVEDDVAHAVLDAVLEILAELRGQIFFE